MSGAAHVPSARVDVSKSPRAPLSVTRSTRTTAPGTGPPGPVTVPSRVDGPGAITTLVEVVLPLTPERTPDCRSATDVVGGPGTVVGGGGRAATAPVAHP